MKTSAPAGTFQGNLVAGNHASALVCFAVREEARFFKPRLDASLQTNVCLTGIGQANAARSFLQQFQTGRPDFVFSCGFAGGLNPKLRRGTIVFATDEGFPHVAAMREMGAVKARFHCARQIAVTAETKRLLWETTRCDAVEMESEIIHQLCRERGVPSATVRVISDATDEDLPLDFNSLMTPEQKISFARLAGALLRSPGKIPALLKLQRDTTACARALANFLHDLFRQAR